MLGNIRLNSRSKNDTVSWSDFAQRIAYLMPKTFDDKMTVWLRSIMPSEITINDYLNYKFTWDEIILLCREALHVLGTKDSFFDELSLNFAKYVYQVLHLDWNSDTKISANVIVENIKKTNEYDRRLLTLLYGSVGIMSVNTDQSTWLREWLL